MCTASFGVPVVPEVWVISVGWSGPIVIGATRSAPAYDASGVAPSKVPEVRSTFRAASKTSAGRLPVSFASSVTR
ncbi:hypothetical protein SMICM17S_07298 [Streptomyces microflavus]